VVGVTSAPYTPTVLTGLMDDTLNNFLTKPNKTMPIENENPLVIPAESEKTLSQIWVSSLNVNVPTASDGSLYMQLRPCDAATGEIADEEYAKGLHLNFWEVISEIPEAAAAMQSVFDAVPAIEAFYDAKMTPPDEETLATDEE